MGHTITARWLWEPRENDRGADNLGNSIRRQKLASQDYSDIMAVNLVLVFSEKPGEPRPAPRQDGYWHRRGEARLRYRAERECLRRAV